jgi:predicted nucleic acid-binding protein
VIVVDASVLAPALADDGDDGDKARIRLHGHTLAAPELVDLEVTSVFRRLFLAGRLPRRRVELALADLRDIPLRRAPHRLLVPRCWELKDNATVYDAAYIALAETLGVVLVTADGRLSRTPGRHCQVELLE